MHFSWTALFVVICFSGIQSLTVPFQFEEEIDNISDSSDDIIIRRPQQSPTSSAEGNEVEPLTNATVKDATTQQISKESEPCADPQVYGMNIGLHYILEDIKKRLDYGDRVHLESLIKVLVLTHKIEKVDGKVEDNNKRDLRKVAQLYPEALREAMKS